MQTITATKQTTIIDTDKTQRAGTYIPFFSYRLSIFRAFLHPPSHLGGTDETL